MSTTIKPLELYVDGNKVYPDVSGLGILGTDLANMIETKTNEVQTNHEAFLIEINTPFVMKDMVDDNNSPFHRMNYPDTANQLGNYWNFHNSQVCDIPFNINVNWIYPAGLASVAAYAPFQNIKSKVLNFTGTYYPTQGYTDRYDTSTLVFKQFMCRDMFNGCHDLEEIHGLNFSSSNTYVFDTNHFQEDTDQGLQDAVFDTWANVNDYQNAWNGMFAYCENLRVLDVTWPSEFKSKSFDYMFWRCNRLPDNQFPASMELEPMQSAYDNLINCDAMFSECYLLERPVITNYSWAYIYSAGSMYDHTKIKSITIPSIAANLKQMNNIIGQPSMNEQTTSYADWKYVIETEAPMTAYLNGDSDASYLHLFNYWDYEGNPYFLNTFGGIYVPDSQLQDWKDFIGSSAPTIAANLVHGLSDL